MANKLVQFLTDDDGNIHDDSDWHYVVNDAGCSRSLCRGEVFGKGDSALEYKLKQVKRGGITCKKCIRIIKEYKAIKL